MSLLTIVVLIANFQFNLSVKKEVSVLFEHNIELADEIVQHADLEALPPSVQKWLEYSQVVGKESIRAARLKQQAVMRTKEDQPWMPTEAEQYITTDEPGFIWKAKIKAAPLLHIVGRDKYLAGQGNMLIKFLSLVTVADARGKEIDQGTMLRYLAETVWYPTAALNNYVQWEEIGPNSAMATMNYGGVTAAGVFTFNEKGEVITFDADRYREVNGEFELAKWQVQMEEYQELDGLKIPTKGEVIWKLETGDFSWYHFNITEIEYNNPSVY